MLGVALSQARNIPSSLLRVKSARYGLIAGAGVVLAAMLAPRWVVAGAPETVAADVASPQVEFTPYTQDIPGTTVKFEMVPIPGGVYTMGSPDDEQGRQKDEGPQHAVRIEPFWMGKCEVTWDEYEIWTFSLDIQRRKLNNIIPSDHDKLADTLIRPTKPYTDMTFGMGKEGFPAICMTQWAAKNYCQWLSAKTGHYYRLPTEAEWEYACRAGTTSAYSFGDDPADLDEYAWYYDNSDDGYHPVGQKKPNPWGLHDIHGNVAEWCLDAYEADFYEKFPGEPPTLNPFNPPRGPYSHVVRGGSWDDDPERLRSAARRGSEKSWKVQDPQIPQSIWYFTDALFVGFRVVRPVNDPSAEVKAAYYAAGTERE
jgi:formylglycine-generating enzyme required for sulfatase activity